MIRTRDHFKHRRNQFGEDVFVCVHCGEHFIEHDGQCLTDGELSDHILEEHNLADTEVTQ
jgi:hypothetical protein